MKIEDVPTELLVAELERRNHRDPPRCSGCRGKWSAYAGIYDHDGYTLRCFGCRRAVGKCLCG